MTTEGIRIELLGDFRVASAGPWPSRRASELVQLLALADGHRLPRDAVIDALWPRLTGDAGAANLRKAAHHARQALGNPEAVVLRGGQVHLFPDARIETDVARFEAAAAGDDPAAAAALYTGDLLPDAPYEEWTQAPRERLRALYLDLLRRTEQWERLVEADPTDEPAYRELMRRDLRDGSRPSAIRWYGRLRAALRRDLGMRPSAETDALYDECVAGLATDEPAFVGRDLELARARALLRAGPDGGTLVVRGPAGIGKSAFTRQVAGIARAEGWRPVFVTATGIAAPYAPLAEAIDQLASDLDRVGDRARSVLAELTPLAAPAEPLGRPLTRHEVIGAVRRLLLAGDAPVVLAVDDAHLADEATIDTLLHLGTQIVVLVAYRPEQAPQVLSRGVARLVRGGRAVELDLAPLDREETAELIDAAAPRTPEVVDRIVELTAGNPFLVLEAARSPVAGVPALVATARDAVVSRLVDVGLELTEVLERLALAGEELDPASIVALTGATEAETFTMLDNALRAGVLVVADARYRFRHELVRQALADRLAPHQQLTVHREMARRLAAAGGAPEAIAHHWLEGGLADEARPWLMAAAEQAVKLGAFGDARRHVERVLEHQPADPDALRLRAEALDAQGDARAPGAYAAAAEAAGGQEAHELRAKQGLATVKLGDPPGALEALDGIEPVTVDGKLAHALALCGCAALGFGDPAVGTAKAAEARRLAMQTEDSASLVIASWAQAAAAHARGDLRDSVLADLHETHALPKLAVNVFDGQLCITQRLLYGARPYSDVIGFADALAAEAERLGAARGRAFAVTIRGEAKLLSGRLDEADADLAAGVRLHRAIGAATGEAFALQRRSEVALARGDHAEAMALLDEALAIARESDVGFHLLDRIYGTRVTAARDSSAALAALEEAEEAVRGPIETCPGCRITLAVPAAIAAARAGDTERAEQWEQVSTYLADVVMRLPAWDAAIEEIRGHRAEARGDSAAAAEHFAAAAAGFAAAGHPLDAARCTAHATS
jgi:DNA-binding SARP family transcriptional activator